MKILLTLLFVTLLSTVLCDPSSGLDNYAEVPEKADNEFLNSEKIRASMKQNMDPSGFMIPSMRQEESQCTPVSMMCSRPFNCCPGLECLRGRCVVIGSVVGRRGGVRSRSFRERRRAELRRLAEMRDRERASSTGTTMPPPIPAEAPAAVPQAAPPMAPSMPADVPASTAQCTPVSMMCSRPFNCCSGLECLRGRCVVIGSVVGRRGGIRSRASRRRRRAELRRLGGSLRRRRSRRTATASSTANSRSSSGSGSGSSSASAYSSGSPSPAVSAPTAAMPPMPPISPSVRQCLPMGMRCMRGSTSCCPGYTCVRRRCLTVVGRRGGVRRRSFSRSRRARARRMAAMRRRRRRSRYEDEEEGDM